MKHQIKNIYIDECKKLITKKLKDVIKLLYSNDIKVRVKVLQNPIKLTISFEKKLYIKKRQISVNFYYDADAFNNFRYGLHKQAKLNNYKIKT